MKLRTRLCSLGTIAMLLVQNGLAWGTMGHKTVGRLAAALLTPEAQKMVAAKLHVANTAAAVSAALADAAEWPDAVAREKYTKSIPWHFIDLGVKAGPGDQAQWGSTTTAYAKLVAYYPNYAAGKPDELENGSDLKFIAHLIGDIHQPLHTATDQDRGGNCLFAQLTFTASPAAKNKFHTEFDDTLVEAQFKKDDQSTGASLASEWKALSADQQSKLIGAAFAGDAAKSFRAWIQESHDLAVSNLYGKLQPPVPQLETMEVSSDCKNAAPFTKGKPYILSQALTEEEEALVKQQLIKAGVRLAAVLNQAAKQTPPAAAKKTKSKSPGN